MKVNAGLYPNANPSLVNSDTKSYALNVLYNEDGETLINENGFEKHHDYSDYGQCIGIPQGRNHPRLLRRNRRIQTSNQTESGYREYAQPPGVE